MNAKCNLAINTVGRGISQRNVWLDFYKIFLSFLIISVHICQTEISNAYARIAVPTFFIISGYFTYSDDKQLSLKKIKKSIISTIKFFIIGVLIGLMYEIAICIKSGNNIIILFQSYVVSDFIKNFIFFNLPPKTWVLWFLVALFVAQSIHYFLIKYNYNKVYKYFIPFILLFTWIWMNPLKVYCNTNGTWGGEYVRNGLIMGTALIELGYLLNYVVKKQKYWHKYIYLIVGLICTYLQFIESKYLCGSELYFTSIPASVFLFLFVIDLKSPVKFTNWFYKWFGKYSYLAVYILHIFVNNIIVKLITINSPILHRITIFIICLIIYEIFFLISMLIKKIKFKIYSSKIINNVS